MKIKVFVVTYKNESMLKENLDSLLRSDLVQQDYSITVVNNYTESFGLNEYCSSKNIAVLHNELRPDFSTGHLARSWNQCLLHGFKSLSSPDCDLLVLAQDDNLFLPNWSSYLIEKHKQYDFVGLGCGDQCHSYTANHIRNVGMWDERFCNIGYQEYDYWIRSFMYNRDRSSINDRCARIIHNPVENQVVDQSTKLIGGHRLDDRHLQSEKYHGYSRAILNAKWGNVECLSTQNGFVEYFSNMDCSRIPNFIYYPYFEKDIDLTGKYYIT